MPKGIMITGPLGAGKTTLGKMVAEELGYPFIDVDDYIWRDDTEIPYTLMYDREGKIRRISDAVSPLEYFVMAGSMSSFHSAFDDMFEVMVLLYVDPDTRVKRAHEREFKRYGERVYRGGDMHENHMKFLELNRSYETDGSPNYQEHKSWMNSLPCAKLELDGTDSLSVNAKKIVDIWRKSVLQIPIRHG